MIRSRVAVIGENLMDLIVGDDGGLTASPGGGPFNVARTVARLGEPCVFLSGISQDAYGQTLRQCLLDDGVVIAQPRPLVQPSATALVDLKGPSPSYRFELIGTAAFQLDPQSTAVAWHGIEPSIGVLYVGTLGIAIEPMASTITGLLDDLADSVILAFDPNCRPSAIDEAGAFRRSVMRILERSDVVKVSLEDLEFLYPETPFIQAVEDIADRGVPCVIVTRGPGSVHVRLGTGSFTIDVPPTTVVDTIGAGDALMGGLLAWWIHSKLDRHDLADAAQIKDALSAAIEIAVMTCERSGSQSPELDDLPHSGPWFAPRD